MAGSILIIPTYFMLIFIISRMMLTLGKPKPLMISSKTLELQQHHQKLWKKLRGDPEALKLASTDYGHMTTDLTPSAVLYPTSSNDVVSLIKAANSLPIPFAISARGMGHSVRGQAMARDGVVVNMPAMNAAAGGGGGVVIGGGGAYADVGGGKVWAEVLRETVESGVAPVSWTDYLYLTVGGTLSNAGISGQSFRYGPQISNVYEMDVVTGKGEFVTCSPQKYSDLFYAVLGGLGQFGIIVRARIALEPAPKRVKWVRMLYSDFSAFTEDQERLIKVNGRRDKNALDYLEGSLMISQGSPDNWRSSFFPPSDHRRIISQVAQHKIIYCLEVAKYYDDASIHTVDEVLEKLFEGLRYEPGFRFEKDVLYVDFLDRVRNGELKLQAEGLWEVPHPWLNLFIPKTRIKEFNDGVFKDIVLKRNITTGPVLFYPLNRNKWDDRMSMVIPEEEVFYTVGFLHSSGFDDWQSFDEQNMEILQFCEKTGIEIKQYLPYYTQQEDWVKHFGPKWKTLYERKKMFDPKKILSKGQRIFN